MAGYAYPTSGPVHAVSKKLLEVTPEALRERRRLSKFSKTQIENINEAANTINDKAADRIRGRPEKNQTKTQNKIPSAVPLPRLAPP